MFYFRLRTLFTAIILATLFICVPSYAATFTFAGPDPSDPNPGNPTDWFNAKNWRPNGVPGANDIAAIPDGTVNIGNKSVTVAGLNLAGTLTGTTEGRFTANGASTWTGGTIQTITLAVPANISFNISGASDKVLNGAVIFNNGSVIWTGPGPIVGSNDALIINNLTGVFDIRADGAPFAFNGVGTRPRFNNVAGAAPLSGGIFRKSQGNGTATIAGWEFIVGNTIDVRTGILQFDTTLTLTNGSGFAGAGRTRITGFTVVDGSVESGGTTVELATRGNLRAGNNLGLFRTLQTSSNGVFEWTGGTLSGPFRLDGRSILNITGSNLGPQRTLIGPPLNNSGTINWIRGTIFGVTTATINNLFGGTFNARTPGLTVDNSSGLSTVFAFNNAGTLNLPGPTSSAVAPTPGVLNIKGSFTQSSTGILKAGIVNTTVGGFDQLNVSGAVALDGTLEVGLLPNAPVPVPGASFKVLTYGSRTGVFARVPPPYIPAYNATDLTLTVPSDTPSLFLQSTLFTNVGIPQVTEGLETIFTVSRNGSTTEQVTVTLSSDDPRVSVPATVTIPAGAPDARFTATTTVNGVAEENKNVTITATANGFNDSAAILKVVDNSASISLSLSSATVSEGASNPVATGTVTRNTPTSLPLTVTLDSSNTGKIRVPATIIIPAGQATATFNLNNTNVAGSPNTSVEGNVPVRITASAPGLGSIASNISTRTVTIVDDDVADRLSITTSTSAAVPEGTTLTGTVSRASSLNSFVTVTLTSANTRLLTVPSQVVIQPGRSSATFAIQVPENTSVDGDVSVTINGTATGFQRAGGSVRIIDNDAPQIISFSPTSGPAGTTIVITGLNFNPNTAVRVFVGGKAATFIINSPTQITATVPANAVTGRIRIEASNPSASVNSANQFIVTSPAITAFSPTSGVVGTAVTIDGAQFTGTTAVTFNGVNASSFTVVSPTRITAVVPTTASTGAISTRTPNGVATGIGHFRVLPNITSFSPTSGIPPQQVVITGTGFVGTSAVTIGSQPAAFVLNSPTRITTTLPTLAFTGPISVTTTGGGRATSTQVFTVNPGIKLFTPHSGSPGSSVIIQGWGLTGATSVKFNGVAATFTVNSVNRITAVVPDGVTTGPISITTAAGSVISSQDFAACSGNVTSQVRIIRGALQPMSYIGGIYGGSNYRQTVTLQNIGSTAISGPLALVLDDLSRSVVLDNLTSVTSCAAPLDSPYLDFGVGNDNAFTPNESLTVTLYFRAPSSNITYTPRILAGPGSR